MNDNAYLQLQLRVAANNVERVEDALFAIGAVAVTLRDGEEQAIFELNQHETTLWDSVLLDALFETDAELDQLQAELSQVLGEAGAASWKLTDIPEQDWHRAWMDRYEPICFGDRLWVCPSWKPLPEACSHPIVLDPGTAFGTGTHPTTALCLEYLDGHDCEGQSIVDFGCGSGVLGIAAAILGAAKVVAIDNDANAVSHSQENADKNGLQARQFSAFPSDNYPAIKGQADLLLANILAGPLLQLRDELCGLIRPGGRLVLSGILEAQAAEITAAYAGRIHFQPSHVREGWVLLHGTHT